MKIAKVLLRLNNYLFYLLYLSSFFGSIIESIKYKGFIQKHLSIDLQMIIVLTYISGLVSLFYTPNLKRLDKRIWLYYYQGQLFILPFLVIFWASLEYLNFINHPNYVFTKFHIIPDNILTTIFLSLFLIVIERITITRSRKKKEKILQNIKHGTLAVFILLILQPSIKTPIMIASEVNGILRAPFASYNEKMGRKWGKHVYDYIALVNKHTPENASILIPRRDNPWGIEGNDHLMRGFFYPRTVVSYDGKVDPKKFDYVLLSSGLWRDFSDEENLYLFPDFRFSPKRIYLFDLGKNKIGQTFSFNFNPDDKTYQGKFGLIEN